ncbi:MAG: DUF3379 family protein [Gammaproteobacteria bacterium]
MDKEEFQQRVYSNPGDPGEEVLAAARENPDLKKILDEAQNMEAEMQAIVSSVVVPEGLHNKLLDIAANESAETDGEAAPNVVALPSPTANFFQYYAMAACLLLAIGVTFTLTFDPGPSEPELAMGNEVIRHIYMESSELALLEADDRDTDVSWQEVDLIMSNAGVQFASTARQDSALFYANPCIVIPDYASAHLMVEGNRGAINVFVIQNSPVSNEFQIRDERFDGLVVPMEQGNLVLVGEDGEDLERAKNLFTENLEWVI